MMKVFNKLFIWHTLYACFSILWNMQNAFKTTKIKRLTYRSKYTNSWSSQLHLLDHSTGIPHISSDLITYILRQQITSKITCLSYCRILSPLTGPDLIKSMQFAFDGSSTSHHVCHPLPFVDWLVSERCYSTIYNTIMNSISQQTSIKRVAQNVLR